VGNIGQCSPLNAAHAPSLHPFLLLAGLLQAATAQAGPTLSVLDLGWAFVSPALSSETH